jgi:hypothetical protein
LNLPYRNIYAGFQPFLTQKAHEYYGKAAELYGFSQRIAVLSDDLHLPKLPLSLEQGSATYQYFPYCLFVTGKIFLLIHC